MRGSLEAQNTEVKTDGQDSRVMLGTEESGSRDIFPQGGGRGKKRCGGF